MVLNILDQLQSLSIRKTKSNDNVSQSIYHNTTFQFNTIMHFQLLSKISAAWQWTVCRRIGLFAADLKVESPLAAFADSRTPPTPPNVAPHDIWIKFLARRFQVIKYYSYDQVSYNKASLCWTNQMFSSLFSDFSHPPNSKQLENDSRQNEKSRLKRKIQNFRSLCGKI